jgi:hypothetical protein
VISSLLRTPRPVPGRLVPMTAAGVVILLALPVYAIMRRILLPFLPDDPRRRRRRAYTTGGLSPLTRA